jgi:hypothetical protein
MKSAQNKKNTQRPRNNLGATRATRSHPPQVDKYMITHNTVMRFTALTAVNQNFTFQNLLDTIGVSTTATQGYQLFDLVRIRRIRVWGMASGTNGTNPSSASIKFWGNTPGSIGDDQIHSDTSLGIQPCFIDCKPSRMTTAAQWQPTSTSIAFYIIAPLGSIIDLHLSFRDTPGQATASQNATVAGTVGSIFYRGLDGLAIATSQIIPVDALFSR